MSNISTGYNRGIMVLIGITIFIVVTMVYERSRMVSVPVIEVISIKEEDVSDFVPYEGLMEDGVMELARDNTSEASTTATSSDPNL
jgi:hypothetical protein